MNVTDELTSLRFNFSQWLSIVTEMGEIGKRKKQAFLEEVGLESTAATPGDV